MKIEIDDDTVYNIQPYQLEDLESNLYYLETHKAMIKYCFETERRNEISEIRKIFG